MRGIGKHTPPAEMQEMPEDNTMANVAYQVRVWREIDMVIHTEIAREIAAWYQTPTYKGLPFTAFASNGVLLPELHNSIAKEAEGISYEERDVHGLLPVDYLSALAAYSSQSSSLK